MDYHIHPEIFPAETTNKGLGVFTRADLAADTIIESSSVLVMDPDARPLLDKTRLHDYIFEWNPDGQNLCCVALGYLSLYNHSYQSNCEYFMDYDHDIMQIKTCRDIPAGTELCINYNGDWDDPKPVWFEVAS